MAGAVLGILALTAPALTACTSAGAADVRGSTVTQSTTSEQPKPAARITAEPAGGATDVSPAGPIRVSVADGSISEVRLTNSEGKEVAGELSADKLTWTAKEALGYGKTYTWSGKAVGADGKDAEIGGSFSTVKPARQISGSLNVGDDKTYGVAMPIAVTFSSPVKDKAAVQKALSVETSVPTEGAWAWLDDKSVHWRPKEYWKPGTSVTVRAMLYGVPHGDGAYGKQDVTATFTIGRSQIVTANVQTHRMVVTRDGQQVWDFPASYGLDSDPGRVTRGGTHVVMSKHDTYPMTNPRYNYANVVVPWAVRISNNGEFIHGYQGSINDQGRRNVSHGCANLSPANAKLYFDSVLTGDPVEVVGSTIPLSTVDGDYYDWALDWNTWLGKSALQQ